MTDAYVFDAVRTPRGRGRSDGGLHEVAPVRLGATVLTALRDRSGLDTSQINDVIFGCVEPAAEQAADIGKAAVFAAGYDDRVPGIQLNRFCGSGLEACNFAAALVMAGQAELAIGGGVESMSRVPMLTSGGTWITDPQLTIPNVIVPQGISADLIATLDGHRRQDVDDYAAHSHRRAAHAWEQGWFGRSVVPVTDASGLMILDRDEHVRPDTSVESLAKLSPSFTTQGVKMGFDAMALRRYPQLPAIEHVHHAGNSSGIVDGAAAVLIGTAEAGRQQGIRPRARIRAFGTVGSEPTIMLTGPAPAAEAALRRAGMSARDVDLFECNEAFASVVLHFMQALDVPHDRVNVNGGAIAMGHPLGATGAMLLGTLIDELERRDLSTGVVALCIGGGMGTAMVIERV